MCYHGSTGKGRGGKTPALHHLKTTMGDQVSDTTSGNATHPNLVTALTAVQGEMPTITKSETANVRTKTGGTYQYRYANLADIHAAVLPILARHGLAWITMPTLRTEGHRYVLVCELAHTSGESRTCEMPLPEACSAQELGSAITYARRYALCAVVGIAPDEDDDGAAAPAAVAAPQQQRPAPQDHAPAARTRRQPAKKTTAAAQPQDIVKILNEAFRSSDRAWHVQTWTTAPRSAALPTEHLTERDWKLLRAAGADLTRLRTLGDALTVIGLAVKSTGKCVAELVAPDPDPAVEEMDGAEAAAEGQ
jgi:hypothetical protein